MEYPELENYMLYPHYWFHNRRWLEL